MGVWIRMLPIGDGLFFDYVRRSVNTVVKSGQVQFTSQPVTAVTQPRGVERWLGPVRYGTFDPKRLNLGSDMALVPTGFEGTVAQTQQGRPLPPSWNTAGYVGGKVSMLTTLDAVKSLTDSAWLGVDAAAPIS